MTKAEKIFQQMAEFGNMTAGDRKYLVQSEL